MNASVTSEAEADLRRGLENAAALVDTHRTTTLTDTFTGIRPADAPGFINGVLGAAVREKEPSR